MSEDKLRKPRAPRDVSKFESDSDVQDKAGAGRFLGISPRTLDNWVCQKMVPFSKLPSGLIRFRRSQLLAFLDKHQVVE
jgi:hypothetical protein